MKFSYLGITKEDLEGIEYEDGMERDFDCEFMGSKFTYLSQGSNSVVFNIKGHNDFVLKMVMYTDDPFIELMKLSDKERKECSLPVLYDKYENEGLYLYLIERCYNAKFNDEEIYDMVRHIPYSFNRVKSDRIKSLENGCMKLLDLYGDRINDEDTIILPTGDFTWDWDIYEDNILMRKNGELVLVDPFCV